MQLSNQPAEQLAKVLVASSNGAFELCGFVSGGMFTPALGPRRGLTVVRLGSEAMEGAIKLAQQVCVPHVSLVDPNKQLMKSISIQVLSRNWPTETYEFRRTPIVLPRKYYSYTVFVVPPCSTCAV
jgi:hypothetical protein